MALKQGGAVSGDGIGAWASSSVLWRQGLSWKSVTSKVLVKMEPASVVPSVRVSMPTVSRQPSTLVPLSLG